MKKVIINENHANYICDHDDFEDAYLFCARKEHSPEYETTELTFGCTLDGKKVAWKDTFITDKEVTDDAIFDAFKKIYKQAKKCKKFL